MEKVIESAGYEVTDETLMDSMWIIKNGIPFTVDSFDIHSKIVDLRRSLDASAKEAGIQTEKQYLPITILEDGYLSRENLQKAGKDRLWLRKTLQQQDYPLTKKVKKGILVLLIIRQEPISKGGKEEMEKEKKPGLFKRILRGIGKTICIAVFQAIAPIVRGLVIRVTVSSARLRE